MLHQIIVGIIGIVVGIAAILMREPLAIGFARYRAVKGTPYYDWYVRYSCVFMLIWGLLALTAGITALVKACIASSAG